MDNNIMNFLGYHTNIEGKKEGVVGETMGFPTPEEIIQSNTGLMYYKSLDDEQAIIGNIQKLNPSMTLDNIFMLATLINHPAIKEESKEKYRVMLTRKIEEECRLMSIPKS
jgi:hypothetical protein